ncbi:MAG: hypothetical protein KAJ63_02205 [Methyloprofundus sp.]|nr:hypothetical protein [Methyloprofundus sp.]
MQRIILVSHCFIADTNTFPDDDPGAFLMTHIFASGDFTHHLSYSFGVNLFNIRGYDPAADFGTQHNTERTERENWGKLILRFDL